MKSDQKDQGNLRLSISESDIDVASLLHELFEAQQLAHHFHLELQKAQSDNKFYAEQMQRLSMALPNDWNDERLQLLSYALEDNQPIWHFRLEHVELAEVYISSLDFYLTGSNSTAGVLIKEPARNVRAIGFPFKKDVGDIFLQPIAGSLTQSSNLAISNLSPAEWRFFSSIVHKLQTTIDTPNATPPYPNDSYLLHSLNNTIKVLGAWPLMLRYESIKLINITSDIGELSLRIRLVNLEFGSHHWESLTYVIGSKELETSHFGASPFLLISSEAQQAVNYYQDNDKSNRSIQFSFKTNQAFEQALWDKLTDQDKLLLACLASSLPRQLDKLVSAGAQLPKGVQAWTLISQRIRYVFNNANLSKTN